MGDGIERVCSTFAYLAGTRCSSTHGAEGESPQTEEIHAEGIWLVFGGETSVRLDTWEKGKLMVQIIASNLGSDPLDEHTRIKPCMAPQISYGEGSELVRIT